MKDSDGSVTVKYSGVIYKFPSADIGELRDSTDYLDDFKTLHKRMEEDSYLLFRNFLDREKVLSARKAKLYLLAKDGHLLPETDIMEGFINTDDSKQKRPENVDIPQEIFDLWAYFKHVEIAFSIDDIGEPFEYQRHPANWRQVSANLVKFKEMKTPNMEFQICTYYYIPLNV